MSPLDLHAFHESQGASFGSLHDFELVESYGDEAGEYEAMRNSAGLLDLGFRGRICLTGSDRNRFLHGQVTNEVGKLQPGEGCYAALVTAKGKMESDLSIFCLDQELLLDFEPGLTEKLMERLERYVIADDVQMVDVRPHYGLLSLQGPAAEAAWARLGLGMEPPADPWSSTTTRHGDWGEIYGMRVPRGPGDAGGLDLYIPCDVLPRAAGKIFEAVRQQKGRLCGWRALEIHRIEAGRPRFGHDMDGANLAPETGIEKEAIRYDKGCYIGQEVIARIRTYGRVNKSLRGLKLEGDWPELPSPGDALLEKDGEKQAGYLTSVTRSPAFDFPIALGYVRREHDESGALLLVRAKTGAEGPARIVPLPFRT